MKNILMSRTKNYLTFPFYAHILNMYSPWFLNILLMWPEIRTESPKDRVRIIITSLIKLCISHSEDLSTLFPTETEFWHETEKECALWETDNADFSLTWLWQAESYFPVMKVQEYFCLDNNHIWISHIIMGSELSMSKGEKRVVIIRTLSRSS